jgi:hypothetical protein
MTRQPALHLVAPQAGPPPAADALARIVPELIAAEAEVARLKRLLDAERVRLAKERGLAFLREEAVRREFGGQ